MKILFVATEIRVPDVHGGSTHVYEVSRHLAARNDVLTLTRQGSTGPGMLGIATGLRRNSVNRMTAYYYFFACLSAVRQFSPDIIYERGSSFGLGAMLSLALQRPLVTSVLDGRFSLLSLARAQRLVATHLALIPQRYRKKSIAVSWGVNTNTFYPRPSDPLLRADLNIPEGVKVIAYIGSFAPWHGLENIVETAQLSERKTLFLLIGDGAEKAKIEALVSARALKHRFRFAGSVPYEQVPEYLALADICVAPFVPARHPDSTSDHLILDPLKLFEYQAMGKPVITTRSPNIVRMLKPINDVCLIPPNSPATLAKAIDCLLSDRELRLGIINKGLQQVRQHRTWANHTDQLMQIFNQLTRLNNTPVKYAVRPDE